MAIWVLFLLLHLFLFYVFSQYQNIGFACPLSRNDSTNGNRGGLDMLVLCFVNPSFSFFNLIISACYSFSDRFLCILF